MTAGLAAIESLFGAGTMAAPMDGAMLFRFLPALQDPFGGGLHLDVPPADEASLRAWLSSWEAFERPGAVRWSLPVGEVPAPDVMAAATAAGLVASCRSVEVVSATPSSAAPAGVTLAPITEDVRDWAAFEVLARWIDPAVDPGRWRWRARRVRHLVEAGRGRAWLARTAEMPVAAAVVMDPPEHRDGAGSTLAIVVHGAHRGRGIATALAASALAEAGMSDAPVLALGPIIVGSDPASASPWRSSVEVLVELASPAPAVPPRH